MEKKLKISGIIFYLLILTNQLSGAVSRKKPMNVLMVVGSFPVIHDICILNQITGLIDRGHKVDIFAFSKGDLEHVQEDVIKYQLLNNTIFRKFPKSLDKYDVIMFQLGHRIFDVKKTHKFKGKVVVCLRGYDITVFLKNNPHAYDKYFDSCDLFLPVCNAFKEILKKEKCNPKKIVVQHSAIDCSKFKFEPKKVSPNQIINIVSAGRFIEKKGFPYSIRAVAKIIEKYPNVRYTIIGDGILKEEYQNLIKELHAEDTIKIIGWQTHKDYINLLKNAHLFVLSSITAQNSDQEGIPNVLKEAMAMGIIAIATDHSGNSELIEHGISGMLVSERDSEAIYHAIDFLLADTNKWLFMQKAAIKKIRKEFDKEKENDRLETILYKLIKK